MKEQIKGFMGVLAGIALGGEAIRMVGDSSMSSGIKSATQSMIGVGILGTTSRLFKWR